MDGSEFVTSLAERLSWPGPAAGRSATTARSTACANRTRKLRRSFVDNPIGR